MRAGWSVGSIQDRYIFAGASSDQIVGRAVAGLNINTSDFAILRPHLSTTGLKILREVGLENVIEGFKDLPSSFKRVVPVLIAQIGFHYQNNSYLSGAIDQTHPLWNQRIFTRSVLYDGKLYSCIIELLKTHILAGHVCCPDTQMQATVLPSHFLISTNISDLSARVASLEENHKLELEKCRDAILAQVALLPESLRNKLLENFEIDGVCPVNMSDIKALIAAQSESLFDKMNDIMSKKDGCSVHDGMQQSSEVESRSVQQHFTFFDWG